MSKKAIILRYVIGTLVAIVMFFIAISIRNIYGQTELLEIYRALSDGFTVPGIIFIGFGLLFWFANLGSFDGIGYALKHLFTMLIPFNRKKQGTYAEHLENKKPIHGFGFMFIIGGVFLLTGIIFMILFLSVPTA